MNWRMALASGCADAAEQQEAWEEIKRLRKAALVGLSVTMAVSSDDETSAEQDLASLHLLGQNTWLATIEETPVRFLLDRLWPEWLNWATGAVEAIED